MDTRARYSCRLPALWRPVLLLALALPLAACFRPSPPVHFYVLASPQERAVSMAEQRDNTPDEGVPARVGPRVGILPITLPGYLQRPQMVVRRAESVDILREDYHRWGEELGQGVARVLSDAMTNNLADVQGLAMPLRGGAPVDMRMQVDVRRFEGSPGGKAFLEVVWTVQKEGKAVREGYFMSSRDAGPDIAALVEAQSALLVELSDELAQGVKAVLAKEDDAPTKS